MSTTAAAPKPPKDDFLTSTLHRKKTEVAVKELLKNGTPDWVTHPEDYRNYMEEEDQREFEESCDAVEQYKFDGQNDLTNEESSLINFMHVERFTKLLKENGIYIRFSQNPQAPQTCGLWAIRPSYERLGFQFVTSMQIPVMPEWGLLHEEEHGVTNGEAAIGWRQVIVALVKKKIASETKLHQIFGEPTNSQRSVRYRQTLNAIRNGRYKDGER